MKGGRRDDGLFYTAYATPYAACALCVTERNFSSICKSVEGFVISPLTP